MTSFSILKSFCVFLLLAACQRVVVSEQAADDDGAAAAGDDAAAQEYYYDNIQNNGDFSQGDDYIKYWTDYAILPKRCIV